MPATHRERRWSLTRQDVLRRRPQKKASLAGCGEREPPPPRLALSKPEAATALGVSLDTLERHVMPELRVVRGGRLVLIPTKEIERWLERSAALTLDRCGR